MVPPAMPDPETAGTASPSVEPPPWPGAEGTAREHRWRDALDFDRPATSQVGAWARALGWTISLAVLLSVVRTTTRPLTAIPEREPMGGALHEGHRYGMPLDKRQAVFAELAKIEIAERARAIAANTWGGHQWSREDDRGHYEMTAARSLASRYGVSLTQIYMVLDEGIRERWPGPNGEPLLPTTPPQDPRSTW